MLFQYDEKAGWYLPYPLAVARAPDVMTGLVAELKAQTVGTVECIHSVHEKAVNLVLDAQPGYAAEHLAWGNHFGARYHILWATSLRPELFQDFVVHPGLGAMQPFLGELMRANESDSGFCKRMEQIRERTGNDRDEAWKLLEASPEAVRDTAVYQLRMAGLYQAEEEYELALPIWAELRKRWPNDASAFSNAIAAHLKLGQRDEAKRLLNNSPACYRRFADYWKRLEEIEGGERKYRSRHFTSFRGQPDLGGLLIPLDAMKPEDGGALMLPSRPISDGSLKAYLRRLPNQKMMLGIVYVEDIYETIFGDGYFTYPNRAFFSFEAARRCAEWISTKPADKEQWWTRAEAKPVEVVLDDKDQLRVPAPQGVEVFNWEQITLIELLNGNGTEWKEIAEARAGAAGKIPVFEDGEGVKTL
jgi:tetratricopeptide (TPR) repeat protein